MIDKQTLETRINRRTWPVAFVFALGLLFVLVSSLTGPAALRASETDTVTLVLAQGEGGAVYVTPEARVFPNGTLITLDAVADPGWKFLSWSGSIDASQVTQNPLVLNMNRDRYVSVDFVTTTYTLATPAIGTGSGLVVRQPDRSSYEYGTVVTVTATADASSTFSGWQGDLTGLELVKRLTITRDSTVAAVFSIRELSLDLPTAGNGGGLIEAEPPGPIYPYGQPITITATPDWLSRFDGWRGMIGSSNPVQHFVITQDGVITGTFTRERFVVEVNGTAGGTVVRQPERTAYAVDEPVTVTATADTGWIFSGWDGDLSGQPANVALTMTQDISATAIFTEAQYRLNATVIGGGSILREPERSSYRYGDAVTVEAVADPTWRFSRWTGDLSGEQVRQTLVMTEDRDIAAEFFRVYQVELWQTGEGQTSVTPEQTEYMPGTVVDLAAEAAPGWQFTGWSGDIENEQCCFSTPITDDLSIRATFKQLHTLFVTQEGQGAVVVTPEQSLYLSGDTVRLRAFPDPGWSFAGWRGDLVEGEATVDFQVVKNAEVVARFARKIYEYDLQAVGRGSVATDPPGPFIYDEVVAIIAVPAWEWTFLGWSRSENYDPASIISTDRVHITRVTDNETYVAHFGERENWTNYLPIVR